jgi:hypothetical protein
MTHVQGDCSFRRADTVRGGRLTCERLPALQFQFIVDPTSMGTLSTITRVSAVLLPPSQAQRRDPVKHPLNTPYDHPLNTPGLHRPALGGMSTLEYASASPVKKVNMLCVGFRKLN